MEFFISEDYENYNHLVEASDNYVVLSSANRIQGESGDPDSVNALYLYLNPHVEIPFNYSSEETRTFPVVPLSTDLQSASFFPQLFICSFLLIFTLIFIINCLTKLVKKGGIFGLS